MTEYATQEAAMLRDLIEDWDKVNRLAADLCFLQGFQPDSDLDFAEVGREKPTMDAAWPCSPDRAKRFGSLFLPFAAKILIARGEI